MDNSWKETVRDIYDLLHFDKEFSVFKDNPLARKLVTIIETNHEPFFGYRHKFKDNADG